MSILFTEIYRKAIALFDDPKITKAYENNKIQFYKLMYTYLQNSISSFNNPSDIAFRLANYNEPIGQMEVFIANDVDNEFTLDIDFNLLDNSTYQYMENGIIVQGTLDKINRKVIFPNILSEGEEYSFEQYYVGEFLDDLSGMTSNANMQKSIKIQIKDILSRLLIKSWAEQTRNFLVDIQNILTDHDFKVHPASNALRSKNEWLGQLEQESLQCQNKLAWILKIIKNSEGG